MKSDCCFYQYDQEIEGRLSINRCNKIFNEFTSYLKNLRFGVNRQDRCRNLNLFFSLKVTLKELGKKTVDSTGGTNL